MPKPKTKDLEVETLRNRVLELEEELGRLKKTSSSLPFNSPDACWQDSNNFVSFFENAPVGISIIREGLLIYVNPAYARMFGYDHPLELQGILLEDLLAPESVPESLLLKKMRDEGLHIPMEYESTAIRKDGTRLSVLVASVRINLPDGPASLAFLREISERKRTEKRLAEALEFNQKIIHNTHNGILVYRLDGRCVLANDAASRIVSASREQLLEQNFYELASWKKAGLTSAATACIRTKTPIQGEVHFVTSFGREVWLEYTFALISSGGEPNLLLSIIDITGRRQAEAALRHSEASLRALIDANLEGCMLIRPGGEIEIINDAMASRFYHTTQEMEGTNSLSYLPPEAAEEHWKHLSESIEYRKPVQYLSKFENRQLRNSIYPVVDAYGQLTRLAIYSADITGYENMVNLLKESENRFRTSVENLLEGFAILASIRDETGQIVDFRYEYVNEAGCRLNGRALSDHLGHTLLELLPGHKECGFFDEYVRVVETGQPCAHDSVTYTEIFGLGERRTKAFDSQAVKLGDGFAITWRDVTEKKLAQEALAASENRYRLLTENARDVIYRFRILPDWRFDYVSPAVTALTGFTPEEYYRNPGLLIRRIHPEDRHTLIRLGKGLDRADACPIVVRWIHKDGRTLWIEQSNVPIFENGKLVAIEGIVRDVTERKQNEDKLNYLSTHDSLTGLFNRTYFDEMMLKYESGSTQAVSVVMVDVNNMKQHNDSLGHPAGDDLLRRTARILQSVFWDGDIVARIGGDEFAVILPGAPASAALNLQKRLMAAVQAENASGRKPPVSLSFGIRTRQEGQPMLQTLQEADQEMYQMKTRLKA